MWRSDWREIYIRLKRFKEASEQLDKAEALATKPDEKLYVFFLRGEFFERQKMYDQAEAEFRKALAIDPHNAGGAELPGIHAGRPGREAAGGAEDDPQGGRSGAAERRVSGLAGLGLLQDRAVSAGGREPAQGD